MNFFIQLDGLGFIYFDDNSSTLVVRKTILELDGIEFDNFINCCREIAYTGISREAKKIL